MSLTIADQYYFKALDNYPYSIEDVMENLNYALSYDDEHCQANYLMGRLYMEILKNFEKAEFFFEQAFQCDLSFTDTYKFYSLLKIWKSEFKAALKMIDFGLKLKGMCKCTLLQRKALVYECKGDFKEAKAILENAILYCFDETNMDKIESDIKRLKRKHKAMSKKLTG